MKNLSSHSSQKISAMALNSCKEEKPYCPSVMDRNSNIPVSCSCFQLVKPSFDEVNHHCTLDVLPILIEETSFPVREKSSFHSSRVQDVYDISMLPEEGNTSPQCASQLTVLSFVEVPFPSKSQMCLEAQLDCQNCIDLQMKSADAYSSCIVDINVDKENPETLKTNAEIVGNVKSEGMASHMQKVLQRQASLNIDKSLTERIHDAPINRWRRYRRAASFDSRKVVLLFSFLSSLGTLVLIYLTLRVRQNGDSYGHI
ncbi:hypothetical protein Dsin_005800 [Dipteronia sinensis]|uniref:Uncharacterized protein n=1 Tax=Dipteronia sinensis TaxID=43782 RepID=A0AAE0EEY8_9ROSI|nr:hypothetical protein Dsin_005800 [Dipteronia sinensis]